MIFVFEKDKREIHCYSEVDCLYLIGNKVHICNVGEVVGMAAFLCKKYNTTPRGVYQKHLPELKALMKEGVGKKEGIPDNQKFNEQKLLKKPRIFAIEKNKK